MTAKVHARAQRKARVPGWPRTYPDRDEEQRLFDEGADARTIVEAFLGLIPHVADRYRTTRPEDLYQEAVLGLYRALERFDPARGKRFSEWAKLWVRAACTDFVEQQATTVRVPRHVRQAIGRMTRGKDYSNLAVRTEWLQRVYQRQTYSINDLHREPAQRTGPSTEPDLPSFEEMIEPVSERAQRVMRLRYVEGVPVETIAARERVSTTRIYQILDVARQKLRKSLRGHA